MKAMVNESPLDMDQQVSPGKPDSQLLPNSIDCCLIAAGVGCIVYTIAICAIRSNKQQW